MSNINKDTLKEIFDIPTTKETDFEQSSGESFDDKAKQAIKDGDYKAARRHDAIASGLCYAVMIEEIRRIKESRMEEE